MTTVGEKLKKLRNLLEITQIELGNLVSMDRSVFSKLETGERDIKSDDIKLYIKAALLKNSKDKQKSTALWENIDELIDIIVSRESEQDENLNEHQKVKWIESVPNYLSERQRKSIGTGIIIFRKLFMEEKPLYQVESEMENEGVGDFEEMYLHLITAFRLGGIRLVGVERNKELEAELMQKYSNEASRLAFIVADVSDCDGTPIRAEFVAYLAAKEIFGRGELSGVLGVSAGYLTYRTLYSAIEYQSCANIKWLSLMATKQSSTKYTANYLAEMMANRHYKSEATPLSFHDEQGIANSDKIAREMKLAIISATGAGRRNRTGGPRSSGVFREDDFRNVIPIREVYENLIEKGRILDVAGEILGLLVDDELKPFTEVEELQRRIVRQLSFDRLRATCQSGRVFMVASQHFRFRSVLAALKGGIANRFVIDNTIAECLLKPEESLDKLKKELSNT